MTGQSLTQEDRTDTADSPTLPDSTEPKRLVPWRASQDDGEQSLLADFSIKDFQKLFEPHRESQEDVVFGLLPATESIKDIDEILVDARLPVSDYSGWFSSTVGNTVAHLMEDTGAEIYQILTDYLLILSVPGFESIARLQPSSSAQSSETADQTLKEFVALERDWDGHGAEPISPAACNLASRFIKMLPTSIRHYELYPEPDGSVGWECHRGDQFSLYLSFSPDEEVAYVAVYRNNGREEVHRGRGIKVFENIPDVLQRFMDELADPLAQVRFIRHRYNDSD